MNNEQSVMNNDNESIILYCYFAGTACNASM